jgi:succinoglycan biosynthesis protein ExoM
VTGAVLIGVASYRRRAQLLAALSSLQGQTGYGPRAVRIAVIDNSPDHELADLGFEDPRMPVDVVSEPEPGISAARNKALDLARAQRAEFLAFIDDDERADPDWLAQLFARQAATGADVVVGVVRGEPAPDAPAWIRAAHVFDTDPPTHDRAIGAGYSSNVLFRVSAADGLRFDPHFGLTGGEDTYFFAQMHQSGARFAAAPGAIVREATAPDRARLSWLLRRWTRAAISEGEIELRLTKAGPAGLFMKGAARLVAGAAWATVMAPVSLGARFGACARGLRVAARGWGFMLSALRVRIEEYGR